MGKKSDAFLLSDGDRLRLSSKTTLVFKTANQTDAQHFDLNQERDMRSFSDQYIVTDRLLGSGAFGKAYMAIEQTTRTQVACKIVDLKSIGPRSKSRASKHAPQHAKEYDVKAELKKVQAWGDQKRREVPLETKLSIYFREFDILASISHPNIISLDKVFITNSGLYIFQDLLTAGDLYTYLNSKNNRLLEVEAATIVWQMLMAVQFLHERNIVHRALKPENIMLTSLATGVRVVLTNFGNARKVMPFRRADAAAGSEQYRSPKIAGSRSQAFGNIKSGGYTPAVDMWSVGRVTALLLLGVLPFDDCAGQHDAQFAMDMSLTKLKNSTRWLRLGERPKSFIRGLLVSDENDRITVKEALDHAWFSNTMHETDFKELYQRTVKHIRPRVSSVPVVDFVQGKSSSIRYLKCSTQYLNESPLQLRDGSRSRNVPIEPPYKPFPRKMHEQGGLWPKRRKTRAMSEEAAQAIANEWSMEITKRIQPPSPVVPTGVSRRFQRPTIPALVRSVTSGKNSSTSSSELRWSLKKTAVSDTPDTHVDLSASAVLIAAYRLSALPAPSLVGADGSSTRHSGSDNGRSTTQDVARLQSPVSNHSSTGGGTADRRDFQSGLIQTVPTSQENFYPVKTPIAWSSSSDGTSTCWQKRAFVALDVRSRSKLRSTPRSHAADNFVLTTPSRRRRESGFDYDVDNDPTDDGGKTMQMWGGWSRIQNHQSKDNLEEMDDRVWAHEEYLRMTNEDIGLE